MSTDLVSSRIRGVFLLALLLAFGTIGWEHIYHSVILGISVEDSVAGHVAHVLRDGLLALPLALVAVASGLWFGRRLSLLGRAALVAGVFGLLLVPSAGAHNAIDHVGAVTVQHAAHQHDQVGSTGLEAADGVAGLLHGLRDGLVAQVVALPLVLVGLTLLVGVAPQRPRRHRRRAATAVGAAAVMVLASAGVGLASESAATASGVIHTFQLTDNPGNWFDAGADIAGTRSLVVAQPGDTVRFVVGGQTNTVHTASSLLWPTGAPDMPFDQAQAYRGQEEVQLTTPGLYVFVCKLHPFMLAAAIVDDAATPELDLGRTVTLVSGATIPTASDLAFRLMRAFFVITNPQNYQVFTRTGSTWDPVYPPVPVLAYDQLGNPVSVPNVDAAFQSYFHEPVTLPPAIPPTGQGVGQVWVDTQYEQTAHKTKPGTATAVETANWRVSRKVALPSVNMNNPHNMWTDRSQSVIYDTQWFDNKLTVFDRKTGALIRNVTVGEAPAHVMTRVDTDQVHVSLNGEGAVVELSRLGKRIDRRIQVQSSGNPGQPHAHWMSSDGHTMVTPNSNTNDSTVVHVVPGTIEPKVATGSLPIASGMMPDASKYYVSNYESNTISVIDLTQPHPTLLKNIDLLANYDPITGAVAGPIGALPIQTPVSPNGKWVFTANTLTGTVTIIDTATDTLIKSLPCDAGCHGVNFAAKKGGGYYAYISSKFSNEMLVADPDPNGDGSAADAAIVGRVLLTTSTKTKTDDTISGNAGMGGQGVLPVPNVYNGWVQNLPDTGEFKDLTCDQRHPVGGGNCP
jgi:DNA-binding beta-propeller fold protein YncE/plastocyanin